VSRSLRGRAPSNSRYIKYAHALTIAAAVVVADTGTVQLCAHADSGYQLGLSMQEFIEILSMFCNVMSVLQAFLEIHVK
jgi:hypothetical protein